MIRQGRLRAEKREGRWLLDDQQLTLPPPQQAAQVRKVERLHQVVDEALATTAAPRAAPSVQQLRAFRALLPLGREIKQALGIDHEAYRSCVLGLRGLAAGCHRFHRHDKVSAYRHARDAVSEAVVALALEGTDEATGRAHQLEQEVLPAIAGLLARYDRRGEHGR